MKIDTTLHTELMKNKKIYLLRLEDVGVIFQLIFFYVRWYVRIYHGHRDVVIEILKWIIENHLDSLMIWIPMAQEKQPKPNFEEKASRSSALGQAMYPKVATNVHKKTVGKAWAGSHWHPEPGGSLSFARFRHGQEALGNSRLVGRVPFPG